jgi:hypothetical protein
LRQAIKETSMRETNPYVAQNFIEGLRKNVNVANLDLDWQVREAVVALLQVVETMGVDALTPVELAWIADVWADTRVHFLRKQISQALRF